MKMFGSNPYRQLFIVFLVLIFLQVPSFASQSDHALGYLNELRERAGMISLEPDPLLELAASNHASYLAKRLISGHGEEPGQDGFTGETPMDRAVYAGYTSRYVLENVTVAFDKYFDYKEAIDSLMSAIYHRFGFLNFEIDQVGMGYAVNNDQDTPFSAYVFNMGINRVAQLCSADFAPFSGQYVTGLCQDPQKRLDWDAYQEAIHSNHAKNPPVVLWPPRGMDDVPPVFYEETPDPLPDYSVSGYPISVQFNPGIYESVSLLGFRLYEAENRREITDVRLLTSETDPNGRFDPLQFALFPLKRLDWGVAYEAVVEYDSSLGPGTIEWRFSTTALSGPVYTVTSFDKALEVSVACNEFYVYLPDVMANSIRWQFSGMMTPEVTHVDFNTLLIMVKDASPGDLLTITVNSGDQPLVVEIEMVSGGTACGAEPESENVEAEFEEDVPTSAGLQGLEFRDGYGFPYGNGEYVVTETGDWFVLSVCTSRDLVEKGDLYVAVVAQDGAVFFITSNDPLGVMAWQQGNAITPDGYALKADFGPDACAPIFDFPVTSNLSGTFVVYGAMAVRGEVLTSNNLLGDVKSLTVKFNP